MDEQMQAAMNQIYRQGGGTLAGQGSQGMVTVTGPNQIEMLFRICDLLTEIRDRLPPKPQE